MMFASFSSFFFLFRLFISSILDRDPQSEHSSIAERDQLIKAPSSSSEFLFRFAPIEEQDQQQLSLGCEICPWKLSFGCEICHWKLSLDGWKLSLDGTRPTAVAKFRQRKINIVPSLNFWSLNLFFSVLSSL